MVLRYRKKLKAIKLMPSGVIATWTKMTHVTLVVIKDKEITKFQSFNKIAKH